MSLRLTQRLLIVTLVALSAGRAFAVGVAADKARYYVPEVPADVGAVDFYLLTVGVGDEVANRFGHTGIRIVDPASKTDIVFNWGKFYFDQSGFLWKFFRGSLVYSMGIRTFQADVLRQMQDERKVVMDKLNLTTTQKRRLFEKIAWNSLPENRDFNYQYWYKNCSTIPRDYLDFAVEGQIRARYFAEKTDTTFRHYVRTNLSYTPFVAPMLDVMMNENLDRPITAWEQMFLPQGLHDQLAQMPSIDDEGNPVPGTHLLTNTRVLLDNPEHFEPLFNDHLAMVAPLLLFLLGGALIVARKRELTSRAYRFLGAATLYWGILGGIVGLTLLLNWAFSGHPDGWHNINLLLFWPIDLVLVPVGVKLLRRGAALKDRWPFPFAGRLYALGHGLSWLLLVVLALVGVVTQDIWQAALWFGVPALMLFAALGRFGLGSMPHVSVVAQDSQTSGSRAKLRTTR